LDEILNRLVTTFHFDEVPL